MTAAVILAVAQVLIMSGSATAAVPFEVANLDGAGNNAANPNWGRAGQPYSRVAAARYADGRSQPVTGPNARMVSNRVHSDIAQNIFSERQLDAWGWAWGQFLDHTFGLRQSGTENENIAFNAADPDEQFTNNLGTIAMQRSAAAPGTGVNNPRQQVNTESSYIDAETVYGASATRLDWLRDGTVDGNPANNAATLMLQNGFLPRKTARGNANTAPAMDVDGILLANPNSAMVAGDVRANENLFLTATHTLFAREHNRIVNALPASLSQEDKFQIARRVVVAEQQFVTYNEWLPAMGVTLPAYTGYKNNIDATLSNEFATVGYRAHSQIHGEMEIEAEAGTYSAADLDFFRAQGLEVEEGDEVAVVIPLNRGFFNPDLVPRLQLGPLLEAIGAEAQYKNDEMIDNQLRSVLFKVPNSSNPDCLDGPELPDCFNGVTDLGAIDIERARDHGMPSYNQLRVAYGLPAVTSFTQITGEASQTFPPGTGIDTPASLEFTQLRDPFNQVVDPVADPVRADTTIDKATRRAPLAAKLAAIYGNVNNVDPFIGMVSEQHVAGSEFGALQRAMWTREFTRLRDGDRFFFGNDQGLTFIRNTYGIDFRSNLGDIISRNAGIDRAELPGNVFFTHGDNPPTSCRVEYHITNQWTGSTNGFQVSQNITNTGSTPITNWTERFVFANGQQVSLLWNGVVTQDINRVPAQNASWNNQINPGQTVQDVGFTATWNGVTNARPTAISLNTTACTVVQS